MKRRNLSPLIRSIPLTRRRWMTAVGGTGLAAMLARPSAAQKTTTGVLHVLLLLDGAPERKPEDDLLTGFLDFGWRSFAVGEPGAPPSVLGGLGAAAPEVPDGAECRLRLTNSIDVRDAFAIEVATPDGQAIGTFDLRFAGLYQVQEIPLTASQARAVLARGAVLRMASGPKPVWFFAPSAGANPAPDPVQLPHVLIAGGSEAEKEFERRLQGLVMLQGFGWQSGCVSEGLLDLAEARKDGAFLKAVDRYQAMYFTRDGVFFESPRSNPVRNRVGGIEEPLPWATLARRNPQHPAVKLALDFLPSRADPAPVIAKGGHLTTEGNYTAAYPTAVLARAFGRADLAALALRQLDARRQVNVIDGDVYQRANPAGQRRLRNWCRGVCWYYLGIVRTLQALGDARAQAEWLPEVRRMADFLLKTQRPDGLWGNFLHDAEALPDTSGSAGLAAALARAHRAGWLKDDARAAAQHALGGLAVHLTPDGLLGGAAQSNKGGDGLQQGSYRVIYQMGMGLKAQLMAALEG
ncbi:MAG: glycoside hydrolase family 88 protein [Thermoguttaceae bacterium]|jgi:rhamnogalacturonyl hydrolase YesR|nr:glycoside hydrolase family 88 protein [Thermoguttaceae bacterium]